MTALKNIQRKTRPFLFYIPLTAYFIVFILAMYLVWKWVNMQAALPGNSFTAIIVLLLKVTLYTTAFFLIFSFLSTLIPFIFLLLAKRTGKLKGNIGLSQNGTLSNGIPEMQLEISPIMKPIFGFLKFRLKYNEENYSDKFLPVTQTGFTIFKKKYTAIFPWQLPEIREYAIQEAWIYLEDMFQFISFTVSLPMQDQFQYPPGKAAIPDISLTANITDEDNHRVDELKKIEGEYLNYKHFEGQDDVRRIAWPVYARSRELVVRIPETLDTYASQVYIYASFYSGFTAENSSLPGKQFLNYYKTILWNLVNDVLGKGFKLTFLTEQNKYPDAPQDESQLKSLIINQQWQQQDTPPAFVRLQNASAIIVSSLCPIDEIRDLLFQRKDETLFIFVRLSNVIKRNQLLNLLSWVFIQQEKNDKEKARAAWALSLTRFSILENEKKIMNLFQENSKTIIL